MLKTVLETICLACGPLALLFVGLDMIIVRKLVESLLAVQRENTELWQAVRVLEVANGSQEEDGVPQEFIDPTATKISAPALP